MTSLRKHFDVVLIPFNSHNANQDNPGVQPVLKRRQKQCLPHAAQNVSLDIVSFPRRRSAQVSPVQKENKAAEKNSQKALKKAAARTASSNDDHASDGDGSILDCTGRRPTINTGRQFPSESLHYIMDSRTSTNNIHQRSRSRNSKKTNSMPTQTQTSQKTVAMRMISRRGAPIPVMKATMRKGNHQRRNQRTGKVPPAQFTRSTLRVSILISIARLGLTVSAKS